MRKNCLSYPVEVVEDVFGEGGKVLADMLGKVKSKSEEGKSAEGKPRIFIVADKNVVLHTEGLGTRIGRWVQTNGFALAGSPVLMTGGERIKDDAFRSAHEIVSAAINSKVGRDDVMLVLGGGTVLDVAGWAAAQIRGGMAIVRLPTTPAAMMDSAYADYAALNSGFVKDALRVPSVPGGVLIDPGFSKTVLDGVWRGGYAVALREVLGLDEKAVRRFAELAAGYGKREGAALREMVETVLAVRRKTAATSVGLWGAQRLESLSGYKLPYGYAIALGLVIDMAYAVEKGVFASADRDLVKAAIEASGALEGAMHSRHLLGRTDHVMTGLDGWKLVHGSESIEISTGLGTLAVEENVDRGTMKAALNLLK